MKIKAPLLLAVLGVLLGGCAWWEHQFSHPTGATAIRGPVCKQKECLVTVTVSACRIKVDPDWLGIAKGNYDVDIVWEIRNSPGVTFAKEHAIYFKEKDRAAAARQFREPRLLDDRKFRWRDANTGPGEFHYGVNVIENGKSCPPLDPSVVNDM